jgi:thioredoxin-related protein
MRHLLLFLSLAFICTVLHAQEKTQKQAPAGTAKDAPQAAKVKWMTFEEAVAANKKQPKKIFIDVYTTWCGPCKMLDANTFSHPVIAQYLNMHFYPIKLNAEMTDTVRFDTVIFVNRNPGGQRSPHDLAISLLSGKLMYPTTVYLDEKFTMLGPLAGYLTPQQIEPVLAYYAENAYKTMSWEEFQKTFKSKIEAPPVNPSPQQQAPK